MTPRPSACIAALALLAACSLSWHRSSVNAGSAVALQAGQRATLRVTTGAPGGIEVELRGQGPGTVTFAARSPDGTVTGQGTLGAGDTAAVDSAGRQLLVEFHAAGDAGTVSYTAYGSDGIALDLQLDPR